VLYCPASVVVHIENVSMKKLSRRKRRSSKESNREFFARRWLDRLYEFRLPKLPDTMGDFSYYSFPREKLFEQIPDKAGRVLEVGGGAGAVGASLKRPGKAARGTGGELGEQGARLACTHLPGDGRCGNESHGRAACR